MSCCSSELQAIVATEMFLVTFNEFLRYDPKHNNVIAVWGFSKKVNNGRSLSRSWFDIAIVLSSHNLDG